MRKNNLLLILLLYIFSAKAQDSIPDADFEQTEFSGDTAKHTYHQKNSHWIQATAGIGFTLPPPWISDKPYQGIFTAGIQGFNGEGYVYQTFPYTKRPLSFGAMVGYLFKRGEVATNNFCIDIILTKNSGQDTISFTRGNGDYKYHRDTLFRDRPYYLCFPIIYNSADTPENCTIRIWSAIPGSKNYLYNRLTIDALALLDTIGKTHELPDTFRFVPPPIPVDTTHVGVPLVKYNPPALFELYPNPTDAAVYISLLEHAPKEEPQMIIITDAAGKIVFSKNHPTISANYKINTSDLADGIYFLSIITDSGRHAKKFIVAR